MNAKRIFLDTSNMFTNVHIVVLMTKRIFKTRCQIKTIHIAEKPEALFFPKASLYFTYTFFCLYSRRMRLTNRVVES
jgi:hypothetical protein